MGNNDREQDADAYAAGVTAARELDAAASTRLVHKAAVALAAYIEQRELLSGPVAGGELDAIASAFCTGFFAALV